MPDPLRAFGLWLVCSTRLLSLNGAATSNRTNRGKRAERQHFTPWMRFSARLLYDAGEIKKQREMTLKSINDEKAMKNEMVS